MDPISHLLVTRFAVGSKRQVLVAGLAADIPFYATYPWWVLHHGEFQKALDQNEWPDAPSWMYLLHHMAHSLPILLTVGSITRLRTGVWPRWCLAWVVHILLDIPTHSRKYWAPQFLWPLSDFTVDGISWPILFGRVLRRAIKHQ